MTDFEQYLPLGQRIILTGLAVKEGLKRRFAAHGYDVTNEHFALLLPLWKEDGQSQMALCEKTCKSKSNVTRILDNMEKRGLVTRRGDEADRRKFLVCLTDRGRALQQPLIALALEYGCGIMDGLTEADMAELMRLYGIIDGNLPG